MARLIFAVLTLLTAVLIQSRPGQTASYWPWCAQYFDAGAKHECSFISWEQCMGSVRGIGGYCHANPYAPPPAPARSARSNHRSRG